MQRQTTRVLLSLYLPNLLPCRTAQLLPRVIVAFFRRSLCWWHTEQEGGDIQISQVKNTPSKFYGFRSGNDTKCRVVGHDLCMHWNNQFPGQLASKMLTNSKQPESEKADTCPWKGDLSSQPIGRLERKIETAQILVFVAQILVFVLFQAKKKTLCSDFIP